MQYNITEMTEAHIASLAELESVCFSTPWTAEGLAEELSNPQAHFLVALCGETVVGYIGVQEIFDEAYITNVAVFPQYRKNGIASALLQAAVCGAAARDCAFITLEVRESNLPAVTLYRKAGFVPMGVRKNFYRLPDENAVIYTKTLKDTQT